MPWIEYLIFLCKKNYFLALSNIDTKLSIQKNYYNAYLNYQNNPQFRGIIEQKQKNVVFMF